jgi:hypothetical protein
MLTDIGVLYIIRGKDPNWQVRCKRFVDSYQRNPAGILHTFYVSYKEFEGADALAWARKTLAPLEPVEIMDFMEFNSNGAGCFREAADLMQERLFCPLNSSSEIMHDDWLWKMHEAFRQPTVGLVGCTGSYEFITQIFPHLSYPNVHIRGHAFLMERVHHQNIANRYNFSSPDIFGGYKQGYFEYEFGPFSLTRRIMEMGKTVLVVEKDRVRAPHEWSSTTYRGNMHNVLVHDRGSRDFNDL